MTNIVSRFPSCKWLRRPARLVLFPGSVFKFLSPAHRFLFFRLAPDSPTYRSFGPKSLNAEIRRLPRNVCGRRITTKAHVLFPLITGPAEVTAGDGRRVVTVHGDLSRGGRTYAHRQPGRPSRGGGTPQVRRPDRVPHSCSAVLV